MEKMSCKRSLTMQKISRNLLKRRKVSQAWVALVDISWGVREVKTLYNYPRVFLNQ
jgi:hypothetical protein